MTTIPDSPRPAIEPANKFTPDAQERMTRLRAMAEEIPDDADPKPLTTAEIRLARSTSVTTLENAALFVEAAPTISSAVADAVQLRDAIGFELAYGGVRDEARALARRIDLAILRRKLKAAKSARGLYRVAKGYITVDAGDSVRTHVTDIRRSLAPRRRPKTVVAPVPKTATK
jgi:hypothetical protein